MHQVQKCLPKWHYRLIKNGFKKSLFFFFFVKKLKILCSSDNTILFKFHQHVVQIFLKECMERPLPLIIINRWALRSFIRSRGMKCENLGNISLHFGHLELEWGLYSDLLLLTHYKDEKTWHRITIRGILSDTCLVLTMQVPFGPILLLRCTFLQVKLPIPFTFL